MRLGSTIVLLLAAQTGRSDCLPLPGSLPLQWMLDCPVKGLVYVFKMASTTLPGEDRRGYT